MWVFSRTSGAAKAALVYTTIGGLLLVWCLVWFVYLQNNPPHDQGAYYILAGCSLSGLTLLVIGLGMGAIGRSAKMADQAVAVPEPGAAVPPGIVATPATAAPIPVAAPPALAPVMPVVAQPG
jgi:hypothetical protein